MLLLLLFPLLFHSISHFNIEVNVDKIILEWDREWAYYVLKSHISFDFLPLFSHVIISEYIYTPERQHIVSFPHSLPFYIIYRALLSSEAKRIRNEFDYLFMLKKKINKLKSCHDMTTISVFFFYFLAFVLFVMNHEWKSMYFVFARALIHIEYFEMICWFLFCF